MKERLIRFWVYGILRQFQKIFSSEFGGRGEQRGVGESKEYF